MTILLSLRQLRGIDTEKITGGLLTLLSSHSLQSIIIIGLGQTLVCIIIGIIIIICFQEKKKCHIEFTLFPIKWMELYYLKNITTIT